MTDARPDATPDADRSVAAGGPESPSSAGHTSHRKVRAPKGAGRNLPAAIGVGLVLAGTLSDAIGDLGVAIAICGVAPLLAALLILPRLPESRGKALDEVSPSEI